MADPTYIRDGFVDGSGRSGPELVALPGGHVRLGEPASEVTLSPFAIARNVVTTVEFAAFLNEVGNKDRKGIPFLADELDTADIRVRDGVYHAPPGRESLPATGMSWAGALAYARWLGDRTGRHYFLPTEAQWEYAARAGTETVWPWGDTFDPAHANCAPAKGTAKVKPVGSYPPNPFGLNDMIGNVWQWMSDCFPLDPSRLGDRDPAAFSPDCPAPSVRGGGAASAAVMCRPDFRVNYWWRGAPGEIGFRVVRLDGRVSP